MTAQTNHTVEAVQTFLRNEARFSPRDVAEYVNTALQDEAQRLTTVYQQQRAAQSEYDAARLGYADAVKLARDSRKVLLDERTSADVVRLDHDGLLSERMDVDVPQLFGDAHTRARHVPQPRAHHPMPDFSREVASQPQAQSQRAQPQRDRQVQAAQQAQAADPRRQPVHVSSVLQDLRAQMSRDQQQGGQKDQPVQEGQQELDLG